MLTTRENELITQTGPNTPMGEYLRRFWTPALVSSELPEPDCPPVRTRILSEDLIAFRVSSGAVGLVASACPHRGASLFFGRNEEEGLRCVYHGWKFDVDGSCVDMPSEPVESNFKSKVHSIAYPTLDRGGIIWAYMGSPDLMPELPEYPWTLVPEGQTRVSRRVQESNFLQGIEGGIDSSHISFLHSGKPPAIANLPENQTLSTRDPSPRLFLTRTEYGFVYGAQRNAEADTYYWRFTPFLMPFFTIIPGAVENYYERTYSGHGWVPMDDENCWMFTYSWNPSRPLDPGEGHQAHDVEIDPRTLRAKANSSNDYFIDREVQRTQTFTGIPSGSLQDAGIQETMGAIFDRTKEHLGTSDTAIIALRRMYLESVREILEGGEPFVPRDPTSFRVRSVSTLLDRNVSYDEGRRYVDIGNGEVTAQSNSGGS